MRPLRLLSFLSDNITASLPCYFFLTLLIWTGCDGRIWAQDSNSTGRIDRIRMPFLENPEDANRTVSLDLNRVDIRVFIKTVGELTGINFLVDDTIQGTVTLISPSPIRVGDVFNILESVLQTRGYGAVASGDLVKIVPLSQATRSNLPLQVGNDPNVIAVNDSLITQIFPLKYIEVSKVTPIVSTLISTGGQSSAVLESNTLLITDTSANIYRVALILQELDVPGPQETVELIQLKNASAQQTAEQITQIMQSLKPALSSSLSVRSPKQNKTDEGIKILPDERINALIIMAHPDEIDMIRKLVAKLDVESPLEAGYVHVIPMIHAEATEIEKSISAALGRITSSSGRDSRDSFQIIADESTNSLIVVAPPQDYRIVENMVKQLDVVREQVLVEFKIVEASNNVLKELGIDWATLDEAVADSVRGFGATNFGPMVEASSGNLEGLSVGIFKKVGDETTIGGIIQALEKDSGVNVLSTPSILTSNHQEASILVADNVPYVNQSRVTDADVSNTTAIRSYAFKDVGIELKVRPHVSTGGLVRMEVETSFSKLIEGSTVSDSEIPTTAQRKATTVISIMSGTTVVIGGLMRDEKEKVVKKVPILGDIPFLGLLFRSESEEIQKTNLLLFITPKVLADKASLAKMTEEKQHEQSGGLAIDAGQDKVE